MTLPKLHLTKDRKVSPQGTYRGVYRGRDWGYLAKIANSFGLPAHVSCPGMTKWCEKICYAHNLEKYNGVAGAMNRNWVALRGRSVPEMVYMLNEMIDRYWRQCERLAIPMKDRIFRIHWDGDFFSVEYAMAWALVCLAHPKIKFWTYTRSIHEPVNVIPTLAGIPNLKVYISTDEWNVDRANELASTYADVHLALCAVDYGIARTLVDRPADKAALVCPENSGRVPLNEGGRGACVDCALCVDGRRDVLFSTSHRENSLENQIRLDLERHRSTPPDPIGPYPCANPDCSSLIIPVSGKGRPRKWCKNECRIHVYNATKRKVTT